MMNNLKISKAELYFSIRLYDLSEKYNKLSLLSTPLRYLRNNLKLICIILENNKEFLCDIL